MLDIISVVLGGGAGTRLFPLTAHRSKPAVPLAGKYRLIDIPVSNSLNSDINRIMVLTQYNSASLNRHISSAYRFDRFGRGFVTILAAEQTASSKDWFQGTADAVRQSFQHLKAHRHSHVLILSGDQLYQMDYRQMFNRHKGAKAEITIATIPVTAEDATGFGILKTDKDGLIQEFHEKPSADELEGLESEVSAEMKAAGRVYLASMGIYIFNRGCLGSSLDEHPEHTDFGKQVIPNAIAHRRVVSYPFEGYWSDIGTIRSFYDANLMLAQRNPPFDMYNPIRPVYTNARVLPPAKVQSSYVQDSLIAEACLVVSSHISNSVIGIRS
ncbi:MAG: sugar phosphate nucleotidyltransferase, partial [Bacteroidota bacterium]